MTRQPSNSPQDQEAHAPADPRPGPQHAALDVFRGTWRIEGHNLDGAPDRPGDAVTGETSFEWLDGGFFLHGHETQRFADRHHTTLMVFAYDQERAAHTAHFFDNGGFFRVYVGALEGRVWQFTGSSERVRIEVSEGGSRLHHFWERSEVGGQWLALCDFVSTKR